MLTSIVRTTVPLIVGALTTFAATHLGIKLPEEVLTELVTVVVAGIYYTVARFLEERVSPAFGRILLGLGLRGTPKYEAKP
ncbi:hypothetical protein JCM3263A_19600 [Thermobifida fusca]|jgi:hypothetical protein|uniref:Uncharacterized protein n=2 Tax=Thermobifida fusca TaxID=2021 RepID=A0A9P2T738_THEFU|nr:MULTISPECIES: hypothetical protein [Thermobifida]AAZ56948.1 hypothetical protein Tfu_2915 [Thermobifida fusca YX]EOR70061.1 hypothetical protein TM51_14976 [Thermobifida fusca TM51]MBO2530006.1 hypothetical protein [Thermobifida sp.]PPS94483.1 hypothetical protein BH05_05115 [Thermobifida fusca]PZN64445.1 MAG: hypothetical protein DIU53_06160 [Thermobifida fusca]